MVMYSSDLKLMTKSNVVSVPFASDNCNNGFVEHHYVIFMCQFGQSKKAVKIDLLTL